MSGGQYRKHCSRAAAARSSRLWHNFRTSSLLEREFARLNSCIRNAKANEHIHRVDATFDVSYLEEKPESDGCTNRLPEKPADRADKAMDPWAALEEIDTGLETDQGAKLAKVVRRERPFMCNIPVTSQDAKGRDGVGDHSHEGATSSQHATDFSQHQAQLLLREMLEKVQSNNEVEGGSTGASEKF